VEKVGKSNTGDSAISHKAEGLQRKRRKKERKVFNYVSSIMYVSSSKTFIKIL
jgi:hypothetical protein